MMLSFLFFCFLAIGIYSTTRKKSTSDDYLLAGREVNPWLTALSAVSTTNSGFMFTGLIGVTYVGGLSSMWLMVGWISGDYLAWRWVFRRFRQRSEEMNATTIPSFLAASSKGHASRPPSLSQSNPLFYVTYLNFCFLRATQVRIRNIPSLDRF